MRSRIGLRARRSIAAALTVAGVLAAPQASAGTEPFIGQIDMVGFDFAPRGWARCDGQLLSIAQNQALFSLLGTTYGGDGRVTFALPNLQGRVAVHTGQSPGLPPVTFGEIGGAAFVTLGVTNLPPHTHAVRASTANGNVTSPAGAVPAVVARSNQWSTAAGNTAMSAQMVLPAGGGQPFDNRSPYLGITHIIALQGIFPSRN